MRDYLEKYLLIRDQFPNKAGELLRLVTTQKRLIKKLGTTKQSKEVQELMLASAEAHDVTLDLLDWTKRVMQDVCNDAEAMKEGSKVRNALAFQSSIVEEFLNNE